MRKRIKTKKEDSPTIDKRQLGTFLPAEIVESMDEKIMPARLESFKAYLSVDKLDLDSEVTSYPRILHDVLESYERVNEIQSDLKIKLEVAENNAAQIARNQLEREGKRATNKMVDELVSEDAAVSRAREMYKAARDLAGRWQALKLAFDSKRDMLKLIVSLYNANYYTANSMEGDPIDKELQNSREALAAVRKSKRQQRGE